MGENPSPLGEDVSIGNTKFEYRNPKQIRNLNDKNSKTELKAHAGPGAFSF
jgi:hypothetical protein